MLCLAQSATDDLTFAPPVSLLFEVNFPGGRLPESNPDLASQPTLFQLETLQLRLVKIAESTHQVHFRLASSHSGEPLWHLLAVHHGRS